MKTFHRIAVVSVLILGNLLASKGLSQQLVDDYNSNLPIWGTSWKTGSGAISHYYPSFYTGFAPRNQTPERIHIRTSRGNQTRVSVILDEKTIQDFPFDLVARYEFYKHMIEPTNGAERPILNTSPNNGYIIPQTQYFFGIVDSPVYDIKGLVGQTDATASQSPEYYAASLNLIQALNPGRVFSIKLNLNQEFTKWKATLQQILNGGVPYDVLQKNAQPTIQAINSLVWGRVNFTEAPDDQLTTELVNLAQLALVGDEATFQTAALSFFKKVTGEKYNLKTIDENGQWIDGIQCQGNQCWLTYPEFTAIYPTGSVKSSTRDRYGNRIPTFATPGLWNFLERSYHEVDHIRKEPYYGWAPKMDFEAIGNGFHNPAVRFSGGNFNSQVKELLATPMEHNQLWAVKRGGVSHGCLRLPLGHVWEMRHIMPVQNDKMKKVFFFGNAPTDFDIYDIDGNGQAEVMGVEYLISYDTQGSSGLAKRDGKNLNIDMDAKEGFYERLYGKKDVYRIENGSFIFSNPNVSFPSHMDYKQKRVRTSMRLSGDFPLYEQTYERDKIQYYVPAITSGIRSTGNKTLGMRMIRLMGRVKGCAPSADPVACGKRDFETERDELLEQL